MAKNLKVVISPHRILARRIAMSEFPVKAVAMISGLSYACVNNILNGKVKISKNASKKLGIFFKCDENYWYKKQLEHNAWTERYQQQLKENQKKK